MLLRFLFLLSLLTLASGQSCVSVKKIADVVPLCARYLNEASFQNATFYLPAGPTKWIITSILSQAGFSASGSVAFTADACQDALLPFVCRSVFPPCSVDPDTGEAFARPVCQSACEEVWDACEATMDPANLPNCTAYQRGPEVTVELASGSVATTQCTGLSDRSHPEFPFECPYPMVNYDPDDPPKNPPFPWPCGLRCPGWINFDNLDSYEDYWDRIFLFGRITAPIITANDLFVLAIMLVGYKKWFKSPMNLILGLKIASTFSQLSLSLPAWGPQAWVGCASDYEANDSYSPGCAITGIQTVSIFSILTLWAAVLIHISGTIHWGDDPRFSKAMKIGVPIALVIPYLGILPWVFVTDQFGGDYNCFVTSLTALKIILSLWVVILSVGFAGAIYVGFNIVKHGSRKQTFIKLRFPFFFAVLFGCVYLVSTTSGIENVVIAEAIEADVTQFLTCIIGNMVAAVNPAHGPLAECVLDNPSRAFARIRYYLIGSNLVTSFAFYMFWSSLIGPLVKNPRIRSMADWFKTKIGTRASSVTPTTHGSNSNPPRAQ